jgi:hypothetical protein
LSESTPAYGEIIKEALDSLVSNSVFASAAKIVIKIGPKTGWKLSACAKLRYVFPNQIWTMSHAVALRVHWPEAVGGIKSLRENTSKDITKRPEREQEA